MEPGESTAYYESTLTTSNLGDYNFVLKAYERPSHEVLPIVDETYFPTSTLSVQSKLDNIAPSARYDAMNKAKVDIVFAFGETQKASELQNATKTYEGLLNQAGSYADLIDAKVETVETSTIDISNMSAETILNTWLNYPGSQFGSNYQAGWTSTNGQLNTTANVNFTGFYNREWLNTTDAIFEFDMLNVGTADPQGWTFRIQELNSNTWAFYCLEINEMFDRVVLARINSWTPGSYSTHGGPLYHGMINGQDGTYHGEVGQATSYQGADGKILAYATITDPTAGFTIENQGRNIKISSDIDGLLIDYTDNSNKALLHGSFGPYTCSEPDAYYGNIVVTMGSSKTLGEAISDVQWRDGSYHIVIHATDVVPEELTAEGKANGDYDYTVQKLLANNCYLLNLGTSTNINQLNSLVQAITTPDTQSSNNLRGGFWYNNPVNSALSGTASYIADLIERNSSYTQYLLVNQGVVWNTTYDDYESDIPLNWGAHIGTNGEDKADITFANDNGLAVPTNNKFNGDSTAAERWRFTQYENHYDNSLGKASFSDVWIDNHVDYFDKTGKYYVNYKRKDNPFSNNFNISYAFNEYRYWSTNYDPITVEDPVNP